MTTRARFAFAGVAVGCFLAGFGARSTHERGRPGDQDLRRVLAEERRHLDDGLEDLARNQRVLQAEVAELVGAKLHGEGTASRCPAPAGQGAPAPTAPGASPTAEAPVASVEAQAHLERAHQIIASAVSRGVWVAEDRDQLRAQVNAMGPAEMESVLQEVGVLLNKGTLRKDRPGPIL